VEQSHKRVTVPTWVNGAPVVAPGANTQLVKVVVTAGRIGKIYGARQVSQEANAAAKTWQVRASIQGQAVILFELDVLAPAFVSDYPLAAIKGNGVDFFEIINLVAGTALTRHSSGLLYDEQEFDSPVYVAG
jgi:hypothetical protein